LLHLTFEPAETVPATILGAFLVRDLLPDAVQHEPHPVHVHLDDVPLGVDVVHRQTGILAALDLPATT
jgi:hypothetical protein